MIKSVVFYFNSFGPWLGFGFCGLILSFAALRECNSFFLFFKQQVSRIFLELLLVTHTLACSKTCDFIIFFVFLKNDFSWNWAIRIGELVSTFRCWQFSRSSFFCTKNITKKLILEFQLSAPHLVGFGSQKEFPFDRCTYRGSLFLHFFQQF